MTAYAVKNSDVYSTIYSSVLAGINLASKPQGTLSTNLYKLAATFAQEFDTRWGTTAASALTLSVLGNACKAIWSSGVPTFTLAHFTASSYQTICDNLIAMAAASNAYLAAN